MNRLHVKYLLIGGGLASSAAAQSIRQRDTEGSVLLVGQEINRPYHRPRLSQNYLLGRQIREELFTLHDRWFREQRVDLRTSRRAAQLDTARQVVTLDNGEEVAFDKLLIATGALPRPLDVPGAGLPGNYSLRTIEDADRLRNAIEQVRREGRPHDRGRGRAVIVGQGLLAVELAATFTQLDLHVDLVFTSEHPWARFAGESTGRFLTRFLQARNIDLHPRLAVTGLEGDGRVQRVMLSDGRTLECDFVTPALGIVPHKELLRGTTLSAERAILVDEYCRTSHQAIFAAGDCAAILDPAFGKYRILDHWQSAIDTGTVAGINMAGGNQPYDQVNTFTSRVFQLSLTAWGEARLIERRIIRGNTNVEEPNFAEIGLDAGGRVMQALALDHPDENEALRELVRRHVPIDGHESQLRDPQFDLQSLLK